MTASKSKDSQTRNFWVVTGLVVFVLIFMLFEFSRVRMALRLSDFITNLSPAISQPYLLVSGLVWSAASLLCIWWLVRRHPLAPLSLRITAGLFSVNYWIEQLWLTRSELRSTNWNFSAALNAVLLIGLFLFLSLPFVRKIFGEHNGRKSEN